MLSALAIIVVSFLIALTLSLMGWFERFTSAKLFGMGSILSAGGFVVLYAISHRFRAYLKACSIRWITLGQAMRFYGLLAFYEAYAHVLPPIFAIPTAVLDTVFATSSFLVSARLVSPEGRAGRGFVAWNMAGLGALAISAVLAVLTSPGKLGLLRDGLSSQALTRFPMSLVPVFIGPMVLIFHLLALAAVYENSSVRA